MIRHLSALLLSLLLLAGCATPPADPAGRAEFEQLDDPLEPMNRRIFGFNLFLDDHITAPLARAWRDTLPEGLRRAIHNILGNLKEPYIAGNELLQGEPRLAADDFGRFLINSTFGLGGIFDRAGPTGVHAHDTDIGITLGVWGLGEGPYLVLPFFGPSNPRDAAGILADFWADPVDGVFSAYGLDWLSDTEFATDIVDTRVQYLDPLDDLRRSALDFYAAMRSLYRQRRHAAVGGQQSAALPSGPAPGDAEEGE